MIFVDRLDGGGECFPYVSLDIALYIATDDSDDIRTILVAVGQKASVNLRLLYRQFACLYHTTPDAHHADIDATLLGLTDDIIHGSQ